MPVNDDDGPTLADRSAVSAALARDPALRAELDLILPALEPARRAVFWREFAASTPGAARPAAAVLAALLAAGREPRR